jgi:hypothetical protein
MACRRVNYWNMQEATFNLPSDSKVYTLESKFYVKPCIMLFDIRRKDIEADRNISYE